MTMTPKEIEDIVAKVYSGEYQYEQLRADKPFGVEFPPWSELTEEQRMKVKAEQMRYAQEMQELGKRFFA